MRTGATLFSGFEGVGCGMKAAGIEHAWGIEYDPDIAAVAQGNGFAVTVADILECDPFDFEPVDVLHASPPCPNFSVAKAGGEETEHDIAMGRKVAEFVDVLRPSLFTLENVYGYRKAESFRHIVQALRDFGYHVKWWHLNSADYGVPQTRRRLILAAALDFTPQRPPATHQEPGKNAGQMSLFDDRLPPWVGWYEAIEDLIPELPDSQFAPWQLERLPAELKTMLLSQGISRNHHNEDYGIATRRSPNEPALTVTSNRNMETVRAFVVDSKNANQEWANGYRDGESPHYTVVTDHKDSHQPRAFVVGGANTSREQAAPGVGVSQDDEPTRVVAGNSDRWRAFVSDHRNAGRDATNRAIDEPFWTVATGELRRPSSDPRAITPQGRVVQMTPRALARFQSFPDDYELPDSKTLACRGIGNAVPPLLMKRVLEAQR